MPNINVFRGSDCPVPDGVCNPVPRSAGVTLNVTQLLSLRSLLRFSPKTLRTGLQIPSGHRR
jgi:hypothetical protein